MRITRRGFLGGAAIFVAPFPSAVHARQAGGRGARPPLQAYVGSYSAGGATAGGRGIYLFDVDASSGALTERDVVDTPANPTWLALHPSKTFLYSANEVSNFEGGSSGSVSAYAVDAASGRLRLLNTVSAEGAGPAYVSVHRSGRFAFVANYGGGSVAVLPIRTDGELGAAVDVKKHEGTVGAGRATNAPPGSFAISGHNAPHAHMIATDPAGAYVLAADLGLDVIFVWRFDEQTGRLTPLDPPVALPTGDGPRHFVFHPNGRWFYSLQEEGSTVVVFDYAPASGRLDARQTVSTLPAGFAGTNFTSEIAISPDARFLYVANRLHDSLACFAIEADGRLTPKGHTSTHGDYPRSFTIDPAGAFLYSCNQRSDAITTFRLDPGSGALTFTGQYTPVGAPAMMLFR